jgi:hypothetical protein
MNFGMLSSSINQNMILFFINRQGKKYIGWLIQIMLIETGPSHQVLMHIFKWIMLNLRGWPFNTFGIIYQVRFFK